MMGNLAIVAPAIAREGITKQVANQIIGLQQKGLRVCLIVLAESDVHVLEEYGVDVAQMPVLQLQQPTAYLSPGAFIASVKIVRPINLFLKKQEITGVVAHAPYAHFMMRLVKLIVPKQKFVLVQYFHGLQYSEYPLSTWRRRMVNGLNKWLARRFDDSHVSVSEVVKQEIATHLFMHQQHQVIYNSLPGYDAWNEKAAQAWRQVQQLLHPIAGRYKLLLPNRIDYNKGQLFFLEVLDAFLRTGGASATDIVVVIAGDGPQRVELEELVQAKGLGNTVILTGALPNAVVQKLLQQVQLVVVPSYREGLPFAVLEALAAKCVVLASETGGVREMIRPRETGYLFKPGNVQDCLSQLAWLYQNQHKQLINTELLELDLEEKFSNEKNIEKLLHLLSVKKP